MSLLKSFFGDNRHQGKRLRVRLAAQGGRRRALLLARPLRRHVQREDQGVLLPGARTRPAPEPTQTRSERPWPNLDWMVNVNLFDNETGSFWKGPGVDPAKDQDRGLHAPGLRFRGKGRQHHQQRPLDAVALPGPQALGNSRARRRHHHGAVRTRSRRFTNPAGSSRNLSRTSSGTTPPTASTTPTRWPRRSTAISSRT